MSLHYDDDEVRQEFSVCVKCTALTGELRSDRESHEVQWFEPAAIPEVDMHPRIRIRIADYFDGKKAALDP